MYRIFILKEIANNSLRTGYLLLLLSITGSERLPLNLNQFQVRDRIRELALKSLQLFFFPSVK